jgi:FMN phosphatase YigB (HAD superfamily)
MATPTGTTANGAAPTPPTPYAAEAQPVRPLQPSTAPPAAAVARSRRCRLPSGERVDEDPRRLDAVVMILEDVLYDHTNMLAHFAIERAIQQLIKERAFSNTFAAYEALQAFRHSFGYRKRFPRFVDSLIAQERLSFASAQHVIRAYYESQIAEARTIRPFDKARETLERLRDVHGYQLGLVCVGKDDVQLERLRTLGLDDLFGEIVFVASNPSVLQLTQAMKEMSRRLMLQPSSMLFVGRKVFYEIKAANKVGLVTVRMVRQSLQLMSFFSSMEMKITLANVGLCGYGVV